MDGEKGRINLPREGTQVIRREGSFSDDSSRGRWVWERRSAAVAAHNFD